MNLLEVGYKFTERQKNFLTDNGGEFANSDLRDICESYIALKLTAAEAPFSNGLVKTHNLIIADILDKVLEESNIDINLAWYGNSNSLAKVHGFSPFQLALGQNPKLPSTFINKPSAYMQIITSKILTDNLTVLLRARDTFIASENLEKICRALTDNVRNSENIRYITGDSAYCKKANEKRWRGSGKVFGQDVQQVLVKYGST